MARDITIGDKIKCANPSCDSAAYCCWYETSKDLGNICTNRNALVCQIRREEVFGDETFEIDTLKNQVVARDS
ncbi:MAG: hypothetical protein LBF41_02870 [Deltaproteobacteria bacterium]|jgi:hypothetical protein|nr:hypothetical protein [Deltaproteobacteria bacterium]